MSDDVPGGDSGENSERAEIQKIRNPATTEELDATFDCLRVARRRYLLYHLADNDDPVVTIEEAVAAVREYEGAKTGSDQVPPRQSVRTDLLHSHLPRLADVGVLDYDLRSGEIRFEGTGPVEEWLERARRFELY